MYTYEYKNKILESLQKYNPIIHTNQEREYSWLKHNKFYSIEIKNDNGNSLFINLEDEFTILFDKWHIHYSCEDDEDYKLVIEEVNNILNNEECILNIFSNDKYFGSGSSLNKKSYTKKETIEFINSFFEISSHKELFQEYGIVIKVKYWDKSKDYEIILNIEDLL